MAPTGLGSDGSGISVKRDYITGPHHYWTHFWCGLIYGAIGGLWIFGQMFEN